MKFHVPRPRKKQALERRTAVRAEATPEVPTYRRNRTMTDRSTVPEVSERARIHYLRAVRRRVGYVLAGVLAVAAILVIGINQFSGRVQLVNTSTDIAQSIDTASYQEVFSEYYASRPFERFRFLTDYDQLLAALYQHTPEVKSIRPAGIGGVGVSRFELSMRQPVASWIVDEKRYYVDADGVTFTKNYYEEPSVSVVDNSGAQVEQGAAIASSRLLSFVGRVVALSSDKGVTIESIEIPTQSMRQLQLQGKGMPAVRMTIDKDAALQVGDMVAALQYLRQSGQQPEYVDVRVEGKAFYK